MNKLPDILQTLPILFPPLILLGIVLGVIGKYLYDHWVRYTKARDKTKVRWDRQGFWLTVGVSCVFSLLLYGLVLERVRDLGSEMLAFTIAFQAGFFCQSVVGELGKQFGE